METAATLRPHLNNSYLFSLRKRVEHQCKESAGQ